MTSSKHFLPSGARARLAAAYAASRATPAAPATPPRPVLSAWERWEMGAIEGDAAIETNAAGLRPRLDRATPPLPPAPPPPPAVDQAELARLRRDARAQAEAEGRRDGHAMGFAEGRTEGMAAGLAGASVHAEHLRALVQSLPAALRRAETELADAILTLALDVARQVVHRTLHTEPEWVVKLVHEFLNAEPAIQGEPRLLLHPDDVALVKNSLGNELEIAGWQVRADETLARGGCRVQSSSGELDGSLETRWKSVTEAMCLGADARRN